MIRIVLPEGSEREIKFAVSPLLECVLSLHVVVGPKHHALQHAWARRLRNLEPALRREIKRFGFVYRRQIPDLFMPSPGDAPRDFDGELTRLRRLSPELLLGALGRPLYDHGGRNAFGESAARMAMQRGAAEGSRTGAAAKELFDDPARFADRLADVLRSYWDAAFAAEWRRIEEPLARAVLDGEHVLAARGVWAVFHRLPANCRIDPALGELQIDLPHDHRVEVSTANPLVLSPSFYVWPHLRVNCDPPWPLAIVYAAPAAARAAEPHAPDAELVDVLRALADDSRLRVLRLIADRPRTAQELEPLVGLSRAGLSKCLRRLAAAGLISPRRDGYYVVYSLDRERIDAVAPAISRYLGGPRLRGRAGGMAPR